MSDSDGTLQRQEESIKLALLPGVPMQLRTFVWRIGFLSGKVRQTSVCHGVTEGIPGKYDKGFPTVPNANHTDWLICYVTESWNTS